MRRLFALLAKAAPTDATILLQGETGTGKEAIAEAVHRTSKRNRGPFVVVDCGIDPARADRARSCSATPRARSPARAPTSRA